MYLHLLLHLHFYFTVLYCTVLCKNNTCRLSNISMDSIIRAIKNGKRRPVLFTPNICVQVQRNGRPIFENHVQICLNSAPASGQNKALNSGSSGGFCGATESNGRQIWMWHLIIWFLGGQFSFMFTTHKRTCVGNQTLLAIAVLLLVTLLSPSGQIQMKSKPLPTHRVTPP